MNFISFIEEEDPGAREQEPLEMQIAAVLKEFLTHLDEDEELGYSDEERAVTLSNFLLERITGTQLTEDQFYELQAFFPFIGS